MAMWNMSYEQRRNRDQAWTKVMVVLLLILLVGLVMVEVAYGQTAPTQLQIAAQAPPSVTNAGASYTGLQAGQDIYYWIVARYPIGASQSFGPIRVINTAGVQNLSVTNFVTLSWQGLGNFGATGYDVIKSPTVDFPLNSSGSCASCAVVVNTASLSVVDNGIGLAYTQPALAGPVTATMTVDNSSAAAPFMRLNFNNTASRVVTSTATALPGQVPVYNADGVTTTPGSAPAGSVAIGTLITGGTTGSVLFVGPSSTLSQNNANMFWNNTSGFFGLNTSANPTTELDVRGRFTIAPIGTAPESYPSMVNTTRPTTAGQHITMTRSGITAWSMGYVPNTSTWGLGPANLTDSSFNPTVRLDNNRFSIMNGINMRLEPRVADPSSPSDGDIWYNSTDNEFKCRQNGATVPCISPSGTIEVGSTTVVSGTANALLFTDSFGVLGNDGAYNVQPLANLVGLGLNTPVSPLTVRGTSSQAAGIVYQTTGQGNGTVPTYRPFEIQASSSAAPGTYNQVFGIRNVFLGGSNDRVHFDTTGNSLRFSVGAGADIFNVFSSNVAIGTTTPSASALFQLDSTTQGFLPPRLTTAQRTAIASPATGLQVYDTTLNQDCTYTGSAWTCGVPNVAQAATPYLLLGGTYYYMPQMEEATRPDGLAFTWVNQGTATETAQNGSLVMTAPNNNGGLRLRSRPLVSGTNYTLAFQCIVPANTAGGDCGVGFRESGTGRIEMVLVTCNFGTSFGCRLIINQYVTATSVPSAVNNNGGNVSPSSTVIIRLQFNGTNRLFDYCLNHSFCSNFDSRTGFFTVAPDEIVWGRPANNMTGSLNGFMQLLSWRTI